MLRFFCPNAQHDYFMRQSIMAAIFGKISNLVNLKRISLNLWSLSSEIKATLNHCQNEEQTKAVKNYYEKINSLAQEEKEKSESDEENVTAINEESKEQLELKKARASIERIRPDYSFGLTYLTEVNSDEILIFSHSYFSPGQTIVIEFLIPNSFTIQAEVTHVRNISMKSRIISPNKIQYRIQARFLYHQYGDRTLLRHFLQSLNPIDGLAVNGEKKLSLVEDSDEKSTSQSSSEAPKLEDFEEKLD